MNTPSTAQSPALPTALTTALTAVVASLAAEITGGVRPALADEPDAVHQLRTAVRRLRSVLAAWDGCFVDSAPIRAGLADCGARLGARRDAEVRLADARGAASVLGLSVGDTAALTVELERDSAARHRVLVAWAHGVPARQFLVVLETWAASPAFGPRAEERAASAMDSAVRRERRRVLDRARSMSRGDEEQDHEVRKAARRLRHVAEVAEPHLAGHARQRAVRLGRRGRDLQGLLGDRRDALLLAEHAQRCGRPDVAAWATAQASAGTLGLPGLLLGLAEESA